MRISLTIASLVCAMAAEPVRDVTYNTTTFGARIDKGYLIERRGWVDLLLFGRDGVLVYGTRPKLPNTEPAGIYGTAVDTDGSLAVSVAYQRSDGAWAGAIVFLDPSGRQTHHVDTGRYLPTRLCITPGHYLGTLGWQRDANHNGRRDGSDYLLFRKYTIDGQETGRYLRRRLVSGLPFDARDLQVFVLYSL